MEDRNYIPDVLGDNFKKLTLPLPDDYEGKAVATLICHKTDKPSLKAILYIHGFNDYFFQTALAKKFNEQGYNFYALDLRKYGRSYLPHQKLNNVRSLTEYDEEIDISLKIIQSENNNRVLLMGHSNGGLIVTNYAKRHLKSNLFHGILCNSPFYDFNLSTIERKIGVPILSMLANYYPDKRIKSGLSKLYGLSLHIDYHGEWNYSLTWKPLIIPTVNLSFIRAIHKAQKNIKNNFVIDVPILVMHSDKSVFEHNWSDNFKHGDAVLNVNHISKIANTFKGNVTVCEIKNAMHDLFLSEKTVRESAYEKMFAWVGDNF
ncbi:alpha/beta hydrolase [Aureibaculum sp. A20]|uniref:Alpha/beta hydrolase n=1 Tax=Aureibaculum flavum TaxID=2795986 RepID=A0ABS0WQ51_9FLAO|nr:alpha/beta hydrolase [Aureibaculum flavum]MBJ2174106.1 alpha/beta hydrolase [Aureibaculum flavum]